MNNEGNEVFCIVTTACHCWGSRDVLDFYYRAITFEGIL